MGFGDECVGKLKDNLEDPNSFWSRCNRIFDRLPIAALVDDDIFCTHGGIGATLRNINEIDQIQKPVKVNHEPKIKQEKILFELLWTDPCRNNENNFVANSEHDYFKNKSVIVV